MYSPTHHTGYYSPHDANDSHQHYFQPATGYTPPDNYYHASSSSPTSYSPYSPHRDMSAPAPSYTDSSLASALGDETPYGGYAMDTEQYTPPPQFKLYQESQQHPDIAYEQSYGPSVQNQESHAPQDPARLDFGVSVPEYDQQYTVASPTSLYSPYEPSPSPFDPNPEIGQIQAQAASSSLAEDSHYNVTPEHACQSPELFDYNAPGPSYVHESSQPAHPYQTTRSYTLASAITPSEQQPVRPKVEPAPVSIPHVCSNGHHHEVPSPIPSPEPTRVVRGRPRKKACRASPHPYKSPTPVAYPYPQIEPMQPQAGPSSQPDSHCQSHPAPPPAYSMDEITDRETKPGQAIFKLNTPGVPKETTKKKPIMACLFCRERKIACGPADPSNPDQRCNQCVRRSLKCTYPKESRRGQHKRGPRAARVEALAEAAMCKGKMNAVLAAKARKGKGKLAARKAERGSVGPPGAGPSHSGDEGGQGQMGMEVDPDGSRERSSSSASGLSSWDSQAAME